jgi:hypothetical protein
MRKDERMKTGIIQVETDAYEYMGLKKGLRIVADHNFEEGLATAYFSFQGRQWRLYDQQFSIASEMKVAAVTEACIEGPIKSDGGSSSYYELEITNKYGEKIKVEVGDIIRAMVGNDFSFGNCVKALRRMYLVTQGGGKEGVSLEYDIKKVKWFLDEIGTYNGGEKR